MCIKRAPAGPRIIGRACGAKKQPQVSVTAINVEPMIPAESLIRTIKRLVNEVLARMDAHFDETYEVNGRPSIPPERLLMAKVPWLGSHLQSRTWIFLPLLETEASRIWL